MTFWVPSHCKQANSDKDCGAKKPQMSVSLTMYCTRKIIKQAKGNKNETAFPLQIYMQREL